MYRSDYSRDARIPTATYLIWALGVVCTISTVLFFQPSAVVPAVLLVAVYVLLGVVAAKLALWLFL